MIRRVLCALGWHPHADIRLWVTGGGYLNAVESCRYCPAWRRRESIGWWDARGGLTLFAEAHPWQYKPDAAADDAACQTEKGGAS